MPRGSAPCSDAVESYRSAVTLLRSLMKNHPDEPALRELLGRTLVNLGNALGALNRLDEAVKAHEEAAEVWAQLQNERPDGSEPVAEQARAWMNNAPSSCRRRKTGRGCWSRWSAGDDLLIKHDLAVKEPLIR